MDELGSVAAGIDEAFTPGQGPAVFGRRHCISCHACTCHSRQPAIAKDIVKRRGLLARRLQVQPISLHTMIFHPSSLRKLNSTGRTRRCKRFWPRAASGTIPTQSIKLHSCFDRPRVVRMIRRKPTCSWSPLSSPVRLHDQCSFPRRLWSWMPAGTDCENATPVRLAERTTFVQLR